MSEQNINILSKYKLWPCACTPNQIYLILISNWPFNSRTRTLVISSIYVQLSHPIFQCPPTWDNKRTPSLSTLGVKNILSDIYALMIFLWFTIAVKTVEFYILDASSVF